MELEKLKTTVEKLPGFYFDNNKIFGNDKVVFWSKEIKGSSKIEVEHTTKGKKVVDFSTLFLKCKKEIELPFTFLEVKKFKYGAKTKTVVPENLFELKKGWGFMKYQMRYAVEFLGTDDISVFISEDEKILKFTNSVGAVIMSTARY